MIIVEPDAAWGAKIVQFLDQDSDVPVFANARDVLTFFKGKNGRSIPLILIAANRQLPTPELDNLDDPDMAALLEKFNRPRQVIWLIDEPVAHIPPDLRVLTKPFAATDLENLVKEIHLELHCRVKVDPPNTPILLIEPEDKTRHDVLTALSDFDLRIAEPEDALAVLKQKSFSMVIAANYQKDDAQLVWGLELEPVNFAIWEWCHRRRISLMLLYALGMKIPDDRAEGLPRLYDITRKPFDPHELKLRVNNLLWENLINERTRKTYRWDETWSLI